MVALPASSPVPSLADADDPWLKLVSGDELLEEAEGEIEAGRVIGHLSQPLAEDPEVRRLHEGLSEIRRLVGEAERLLEPELDPDAWVVVPPKERFTVRVRFVFRGRGRPDPPPPELLGLDDWETP